MTLLPSLKPATAPATDRIVALDALRGLAVLGIAWMNVHAFALPLQAYYNPTAFGLETAADRWVWLASLVFVEDKFRTLFAILFGAGCLTLLEKDQDNPVRAHVARMGVLFLIGLAHSIFLASNDVLRVYAIAGLALPVMRGFSPYALYAIAIGLVVVHIGLGMVAFGSGILDFYQGQSGTDAALFLERNFGSDAVALRSSMVLGEESLVDRIVRRASSIPSQIAVLSSSLPINLAAMTIGMGLWRQRMLAGEWRTFRLQRLAGLCALISIPALLLLAWWVGRSGFSGAVVGAAALVLSAPFDMLLGLAYAMLVMAFANASSRWTKGLAAVGRLSLSNYIATSVIFAAIFASWGLGWFGEVSRSEAFLISFIPIGLALLWSPLWLRAFGQGPLERLWRASSRALS